MSSPAAIAIAEHAYNIEVSDDLWLRELLEAGLPILNSGAGVVGVAYVRQAPGEIGVQKFDIVAGPAEFVEAKQAFMAEATPAMIDSLTRPGMVTTASEALTDHPGGIELWQKHYGWMTDALGMTAMDPDGQGIVIVAGRKELSTLNKSESNRFHRIGVHIAAGHRIRRGLTKDDDPEIPLCGEAAIDAASFKPTDAVGPAASANALDKLRAAARSVDKARSRLRRSDPDAALEIWTGLVEGRWSLVDWHDSDGKRYIIAKPNQPGLGDPRGLSEREHQVASFAALGEGNKLIGYRLGISQPTVSEHLHNAMSKLGVSTTLELHLKLKSPVPDTDG